MSSTEREALVVGGGIIGTTAAFRLARAGWHVSLFDPDPGSGATWAAAGMIAPSAEVSPGEEANYEQQRRAVNTWRDLVEELVEVTGNSVALAETGTLLVGYDASDRRLVDQFAGVANEFGAECLRVTRNTHPTLFDGVSPRIPDGLLLGGDAWLDPDEAMTVLAEANRAVGVVVVNEQVLSASRVGTHVEVGTERGTYRGDIGILATGARALPEGVVGDVAHVVRPVRGMTVRVKGPDRSSQPVIRAFVRGRMFYMVSRPGGYCVLGASSDEKGELLVEIGDLQRLLRDALDVVPSLESASMIETRQGLRPASKDLRPFFEIVDERWAWMSGHYRHGVTLAPMSSLEAVSFARGFA